EEDDQEQWNTEAFEEIKAFNILVLGERQSGKSVLIEAIKNYARHDILDLVIPNYTPTTDVKSTLITTSLPRFSIFEGADDQDEGPLPNQLNNDDIFQYLSLVDEEYEQLKPNLHIQKDQQTLDPRLDFIKDGSRSHTTDGESGVFVTKTLPAIVRHLGSTFAVHLVLLVISDTDNCDNSEAINFYRDVLPAFDFITVIARTGVKNDNATPTSEAPQSRHKSPYGESHADQIYFAIDNIFIRDDPIRNCLARNDIHRILELALMNEPVFMQPKKPSFIKDLDKFLEDRYFEVLKTIHDAVATADESSQFHTILRLARIQCDEDAHEETILSSSPLKLIFSRRFENAWDAPTSHVSIEVGMGSTGRETEVEMEPTEGEIEVEMESTDGEMGMEMEPTEGEIEVEIESTEGEIAHVDILQHNVEIVKQDGGVGADRLRLAFRWTSTLYGVLDIRIYVNAATTSFRSNDTQENVTRAIQNAVSNSNNPSDQHNLIMEFLERYRHFHAMHCLTSANAVHPEAIQILAICDIDQTIPLDLFEYVEKLEKAYINIADTYKSKTASRSVYPSVNRFREHLVDRRILIPANIESISLSL
ncbi:hypothetical protein BGX21_003198, partial [Mortierella sp. AD011]